MPLINSADWTLLRKQFLREYVNRNLQNWNVNKIKKTQAEKKTQQNKTEYPRNVGQWQRVQHMHNKNARKTIKEQKYLKQLTTYNVRHQTTVSGSSENTKQDNWPKGGVGGGTYVYYNENAEKSDFLLVRMAHLFPQSDQIYNYSIEQPSLRTTWKLAEQRFYKERYNEKATSRLVETAERQYEHVQYPPPGD